MKRGFLLFVSLAVIAVQSLFAQNFTVKGTVIEAETNEPLIGVAIMQEGTNNGVTTDIDGNYSIEIKGVAQATLVYSYIGMQQQQHVEMCIRDRSWYHESGKLPPCWAHQNSTSPSSRVSVPAVPGRNRQPVHFLFSQTSLWKQNRLLFLFYELRRPLPLLRPPAVHHSSA